MFSVVKPRRCPRCQSVYYLSDGRYKYCCDECAEAARLAHSSQVAKPYETLRERRRKRFLDEYWRRCTEACKKLKIQRRGRADS